MWRPVPSARTRVPGPDSFVPSTSIAALVVVVVVALVVGCSTTSVGADEADGDLVRSDAQARVYFDLSLTGSELDGPLPQGGYDADLFRGVGLAFEAGRRLGPWRVGGEIHGHYADNSLVGNVIGDNTVSFVALTANGWRDVRLSRRFGVYLGAGIGAASVEAELSGYEGDPAYEDYYDARASTTVAAGQVMAGGSFDASGRGRARLHVGFRYFTTAGLGMRDSLGRPFDEDAVRMPMAVLGLTWVMH